MESLFDVDWLTSPVVQPVEPPPLRVGGRDVTDRSFPSRVAALLRSRPIADIAASGARQDWPAETYDFVTFALSAIDLVTAHQGFEDEATYQDVVASLTDLARQAAPGRPRAEHARVARHTVDGLLNRPQRGAPFTYRVSDYAGDVPHRLRQVQFRLLVEHEDPVRGEVVLHATGDAINALVGGLEFEVEDEQVANEILLERQLARGAFDAAERSAIRARLLSVSLADGLDRLVRATRRDLRAVLDDWATIVPRSLDAAREHIRGRLEVEDRLLLRVRETIVSAEPEIAAASARIASLLEDSRSRHELLHSHVIEARAVFLEEQDRQAFRPPVTGHLPDLFHEVLSPMLGLDGETATALAACWISDVSGPRPPKLARLYRVVNDLWAVREGETEAHRPPPDDEVDVQEDPVVHPLALRAAERAVATTGLPARLSALLAACHSDPHTPTPQLRRQASELTALAALWCCSPEESADETRADIANRIFGPRAAADADGLCLRLPGWDGDDLIVVARSDDLATAQPVPVTVPTAALIPPAPTAALIPPAPTGGSPC